MPLISVPLIWWLILWWLPRAPPPLPPLLPHQTPHLFLSSDVSDTDFWRFLSGSEDSASSDEVSERLGFLPLRRILAVFSSLSSLLVLFSSRLAISLLDSSAWLTFSLPLGEDCSTVVMSVSVLESSFDLKAVSAGYLRGLPLLLLIIIG